MADQATIKRIDNLEAFGRMIIAEASELRKSLSPVQGRASRKGLSAQQKAGIVSKRMTRVMKTKRNG
jgi:hypothetical protein